MKYTVTVKTGNVKDAGTKAKVYIKLFETKKTGVTASTPPLQLTGAASVFIFEQAS